MSSETTEKVAFLERFKADIVAHFRGGGDEATRVRINRGMRRAKEIVSEAGAMKSVTLSPPPAIGGMIVRDADPFNFILRDYYGMSMAPAVADMIEEAIGFLESPEYEAQRQATQKNAANVPAKPIPRGLAKAAADEVKEPELPAKVTLSWLVRHVPISVWLWLAGALAAALAVGAKFGPLLK